jgi:hypothetical protein
MFVASGSLQDETPRLLITNRSGFELAHRVHLDVPNDESARTAIGVPTIDDGGQVDEKVSLVFSHSWVALRDMRTPRAKHLVVGVVEANGIAVRGLESAVVVLRIRRAGQPPHRAVRVADDGAVTDLVDVAHLESELRR